MIALGIDPGRSDGALAVLDLSGRKATLVQALAWSTVRRKSGDMVRLWPLHGGGGVVVIAPGMLPLNVRAYIDSSRKADRVAVEGPPPRVRGHKYGMSLDHVREVGRVCGWVEALTGITPESPAPDDWRRRVFRLPARTDAKSADAAILRLLPALVTLPAGIPQWALKHLPDACGVALSLRTP